MMVELRKPVVVVYAVAHEELDATRTRSLGQGEFRLRRFTSVADGPTECERAVERACKTHTHLVANCIARADGIIDDCGKRTRLCLGETGVEQDQSHVAVVEGEDVG